MPARRHTDAADVPVFLRLPRVRQLTGLGKSTIYRLIALDEFPRPVQLGQRAVGWRSADVERWSAERPMAPR
jgi:prophage regulatory protein